MKIQRTCTVSRWRVESQKRVRAPSSSSSSLVSCTFPVHPENAFCGIDAGLKVPDASSQVESEKDSSIKRSALLRWAKPKVMIEQVKWSSKSDLELDPKPCKPILSVSDIFNGTTTSWRCRFLLHQDNNWEYPRTVRINHIESTHYLLCIILASK